MKPSLLLPVPTGGILICWRCTRQSCLLQPVFLMYGSRCPLTTCPPIASYPTPVLSESHCWVHPDISFGKHCSTQLFIQVHSFYRVDLACRKHCCLLGDIYWVVNQERTESDRFFITFPKLKLNTFLQFVAFFWVDSNCSHEGYLR